MLLYIILPVAFVLCIALPAEFDILRYLFMTACAASVGMLWYRQSFSSSLRTGITIGYGLMCVVVIVMHAVGLEQRRHSEQPQYYAPSRRR